MTPKKKDEFTDVLKKAHEITALPNLLREAYSKEQVIKIIEIDRQNQQIDYAHFLQRL